MSTPPPASTTTVHLVATYTSPSQPTPQTLSSTPLSLPQQSSLSVSDKTAYLASLRTATIALQERINADLTARMEQDVAAAAAAATTTQKPASGPGFANKAKTTAQQVNDIAEEENYGEEEVPEDD